MSTRMTWTSCFARLLLLYKRYRYLLGLLLVICVLFNYNEVVFITPKTLNDGEVFDLTDSTYEYIDETSITHKDCQFQKKFGFLKTHKTASSTLFSILARLAIQHESNLVLNYKRVFLNYRSGNTFSVSSMARMPFHKDFLRAGLYDMSLLHARWNYSEFRKILGPQAKFATIIRKPSTQFESAYVYFHYRSVYRMDFAEFVDNLSRNTALVLDTASKSKKYGFNNQLIDLGVDISLLRENNHDYIQSYVHNLTQQFDLVMIMERWEESLVLLADLLCVPLSEMVNARRKKLRKEKGRTEITDHMASTLSRHQQADELLYAHFSRIFDRKVAAFGEQRMQRAVEELRQHLARLKDYCGTKHHKDQYNSTLKEQCHFHRKGTPEMIHKIRTQQLARWEQLFANHSLKNILAKKHNKA